MAQKGGSNLIRNLARNKVLSRPHNVDGVGLTSEKSQNVDDALPNKNDEKPINTLERERMISFQRTLFSPSRIIGTKEEIVPFAWRNPLDFSKQKHKSKYLKNLELQKEKARKEREKNR